MTATLWAAVSGVLLLFVGGWILMRKAAKAERADILEDTLERAKDARDARNDPDALERVRDKYRY